MWAILTFIGLSLLYIGLLVAGVVTVTANVRYTIEC